MLNVWKEKERERKKEDGRQKKECTSKTEDEIHIWATHSERKKKSQNNNIELIPDSHVKTYHFAD